MHEAEDWSIYDNLLLVVSVHIVVVVYAYAIRILFKRWSSFEWIFEEIFESKFKGHANKN